MISIKRNFGKLFSILLCIAMICALLNSTFITKAETVNTSPEASVNMGWYWDGVLDQMVSYNSKDGSTNNMALEQWHPYKDNIWGSFCMVDFGEMITIKSFTWQCWFGETRPPFSVYSSGATSIELTKGTTTKDQVDAMFTEIENWHQESPDDETNIMRFVFDEPITVSALYFDTTWDTNKIHLEKYSTELVSPELAYNPVVIPESNSFSNNSWTDDSVFKTYDQWSESHLDISGCDFFECDMYISESDWSTYNADAKSISLAIGTSSDATTGNLNFTGKLNPYQSGWNHFKIKLSDYTSCNSDADLKTLNRIEFIHDGMSGRSETMLLSNICLTSIIKGDCNEDLTVDVKDLVRMKKNVADSGVYANKDNSDLDNDNVINAADIGSLLKILLSINA